tara:strand:- start:243 stop:809 length:567 start_codon:yes stop_codon:yes gene_type:complete
MPVSVLYVQGEGLSMTKFFGAPILGVLLQAFATIFLFVSLYLLVYQDFSFIDSVITSFQLTLGSNSLGAAITLFVLVAVVLMFFSGGDFDFLIGIVVYSLIIGGSFIPEIPNFFTVILIILTAVFNLFITPLIVIPLTNMLGITSISLSDPADSMTSMTMGSTLIMNFIQTVVGLVPAMIYLNWLMQL